jgi:hypothetical protein
MHACAAGLVMVDYNSSRNILACQRQTQNVQFRIRGWEPRDARLLPMHVCGSATGSQFAMSGIREDQNKFLCAF